MYQELSSWQADWPLQVPAPPATDIDPRQSLVDLQRFYNTYPDRWSPLKITEFISDAITRQTAYDRQGRAVHPSAFVDNVPWSFFSASRLATVPRLAYFSRQQQAQAGAGSRALHRSSEYYDRNSTEMANTAKKPLLQEGPLALMFHGSPSGLDILKRGARFLHNKDDAQGIYMSPSLTFARVYADIRRVGVAHDVHREISGKTGLGGGPNHPEEEETKCSGADSRIVSNVSAAALRQRGVLVCLVSLGKVYHRYAQQDPEVEKLIAEGKWALEGSTRSDAAANAAKELKKAASSLSQQESYDGFEEADHRKGVSYHFDTRGGRGGGSGSNKRSSNVYNPNDDPSRPFDSYVDFVDGEQIYCVRNPDNIIPVVALALNKQSGLGSM